MEGVKVLEEKDCYRAKNILKKKKVFLWILLLIISLGSMLFIFNDEGLYNKPIAKIISIEEQ